MVIDPSLDTQEWREQGRCFDSGVDFFPSGKERSPVAKRQAEYLIENFCFQCPVRYQCCQEGLTPGTVGIWGGFFLQFHGVSNNARTKVKKAMREWCASVEIEDAVA